MAVAFVAMGANLGDRLATLNTAVRKLQKIGEIVSASSIYETDPVGFVDQPAYLNAVVLIKTRLSPHELLQQLLAIEIEHGRERSFQNAPRTLDLDLLLYDDLSLSDTSLTLPHPRMHERGFVLVPLVEIAPDVVIPGTTRTARMLLDELLPISGIHHFSNFEPLPE